MSLRDLMGIFSTIVGVVLAAFTAAALHQNAYVFALGAGAGALTSLALGWRSLSRRSSVTT